MKQTGYRSARALKIGLSRKLKHLKTNCSRGHVDLMQLERSDSKTEFGGRFQNDSEDCGRAVRHNYDRELRKKRSGTELSDECLFFGDIQVLIKKKTPHGQDTPSDILSQSYTAFNASKTGPSASEAVNEMHEKGPNLSDNSKSIGTERRANTSKSIKKAGTRYRCDICKRTCSSLDNLKRHMYIHAEDKPYSCSICKTRFIRKERLKEHVSSVHDGHKPYKCDICNKTFSLKHNLKSHMNHHFPTLQFSCSLCNRSSKHRADACKHMKKNNHESLVIDENFRIIDQDERAIPNLQRHKTDTEKTAGELVNLIADDNTDLDDRKRYDDDYKYSPRAKKELRLENEDRGYNIIMIKDANTEFIGNGFQGVYEQKEAIPDNACRCQICLRTFSCTSNLKRHMYLHSSKLPHSCPMCHKGFARKDALNLHIVSYHEGKKAFSCDRCKKTFARRHNLEEHKQRHLSVRNFSCGTCGKSSKTQTDLTKHIRRKHPEKRSRNGKARDVDKVQTVLLEKPKADAAYDMSNTSGDTANYQAEKSPEDSALWNKTRSFNPNMSTISESLPSCKTSQSVDVIVKEVRHLHMGYELNKSGEDPEGLKISEDNYDCIQLPMSNCNEPYCGGSKRHASSKENKKPDSIGDQDLEQDKSVLYECHICDKVFTVHARLKRHLLIHSEIKPFVCSICGQGFTRKAGLQVHIYSVHTGYRPYACNVCPKTFTTRNHLNNHVLCHSLERSFLCIFCNKGFKTKSNLGKHMKRNHSPSKKLPRVMDQSRKHVCLECNRRYLCKDDLKKHMKRSHVNNDRYICVVCKKDYKELKTFEQHEERHRMETGSVYECTDCKTEFMHYDEIKEHVESCT